MGDYVNFHDAPKPPKKELPDHEVFNNALMRAQAAGEKPSAGLFARIDKEYNEKKKEKQAMMPPPRSPLMTALLGAGMGTGAGGIIAPKGKLLKYMLGGAASGGAIGGAMGLGHNLGSVTGDAISHGMGFDEKGNASAATQIAARLAGLGGGAYLGLKAHKRIGEELDLVDEPKKKEKKAMSFSMSAARQPVKLAGIGTTVGILGGLTSGRGDDKLRSAGRGAIKGMGFDVGAGVGGALGGALGATLNPELGLAGLVGGGLGGGVLGQSLASSAIGPYETEEEKFERMLAARESAQLKLKNKEKAAMSLYSFGAKLAQSTCSPCDMPNGPTNGKKPYTSASPAVTDASQKSVEIGKPPVTETEHSAAKAKLPEEGVKSARIKQANPLLKMIGMGAKPAATAAAATGARAAAPVARAGLGNAAAAAGKKVIKPGDLAYDLITANRQGQSLLGGAGAAKPVTRPAPPPPPPVPARPATAPAPVATRPAPPPVPPVPAKPTAASASPNSFQGAESINPANVPIPRGQMRPNGFTEAEIRAAQGANFQPVRRSSGTDTIKTLAGPQSPAAPAPVPPPMGKGAAMNFGVKLAERWAFDGQGSGDAYARNLISSKLPKPSSAYSYGPGGGGAGFPDVAGLVSTGVNAAGVNPSAYGAAPSQGPVAPASSGPSLGRRNPNSTSIDELFQASRNMMPKIESKPNPRYVSENVDAGVPGAVEAFKAQQAAKVPTPNMGVDASAARKAERWPAISTLDVASQLPGVASNMVDNAGRAVGKTLFGGSGKALGTPNVNFDSSGPQFGAPAGKSPISDTATSSTKTMSAPKTPNSAGSAFMRAFGSGGKGPGGSPGPKTTNKPSAHWSEDPFGDKPAPAPAKETNYAAMVDAEKGNLFNTPPQSKIDIGKSPEAPSTLAQAMEWMGKNPGYTAAGGLGAAGLAALLYHMNQPKKKKRDDDEE
jgi:hypothetical protein